MKSLIAVLTALVLLFSCVGCTPREEKTTLVRVNEVTHSVFYAPLYAAMGLGYFEEESLKVELTNGGGCRQGDDRRAHRPIRRRSRGAGSLHLRV